MNIKTMRIMEEFGGQVRKIRELFGTPITINYEMSGNPQEKSRKLLEKNWWKKIR